MKTANIRKTKHNKTKAWFLLGHPAGKWIGSILQLQGALSLWGH